jgi:hypothetical protein
MSYAFSICHVDNLRHQNGCALWTRNRELITHSLSNAMAMGAVKDLLHAKLDLSVSSYSRDGGTHWGLLPEPTEAMKAQARLIQGRFSGDPSYENEHTEIKKITDGDEIVEEEETVGGLLGRLET